MGIAVNRAVNVQVNPNTAREILENARKAKRMARMFRGVNVSIQTTTGQEVHASDVASACDIKAGELIRSYVKEMTPDEIVYNAHKIANFQRKR